METIVFFLVFLLGIAGGYIWRDHISRTRHDRARREEKRLTALRSADAAYRSRGSLQE
jgi:hypothetical protein